MKRYRKYITGGIVQPLSEIPFHSEAPIRRLLMLGKNPVPGSNVHIAVHFIRNLPRRIPRYSKPHKHDCDEVNLILSENGKLIYRIQLGDETYKVGSPASVFIPRGVKHNAEVLSGKGIFVCIILRGKKKSNRTP